jgi:hypothetical protein
MKTITESMSPFALPASRVDAALTSAIPPIERTSTVAIERREKGGRTSTAARGLRDTRWKRICWLSCCMATLHLAGCKRVNVVNDDDAIPDGKRFWQLLQTNDVPNAVEMYDSSVWRTDPGLRDRWSTFLDSLGSKFGSVASAELTEKKWFPGSSLVSDHRATFLCYAYAYEVKRQALVSHERLIICGDGDASHSSMRIYGHDVKRQDTQQAVRVGVDWVEKRL